MKNFWKFLRENFNLNALYGVMLVLPLSLLLVFQGCLKDPNAIGLNLKGDDDLLNATFTDTVTLSAYSVLEDTLNTTNLVSNFLGFIRDPVFGLTSTGIFTQIVPNGNSVNFGDSPQLDSIVLTLRYASGFYGDTLNPFVVQVYRVTEDILSDKNYYQNHILAHSSNNLTYRSDFHLYPKPNSKVRLDTIVEAHARIRLDDELGNLLLRSSSEMLSNARFKNFFKGLYICAKPLSNNGSLVNFNLTSALSGIQLYYKNDTVARRFQFLMNNETIRISNYDHDYNSGDSYFVSQVIDNDSLLGKNMLYVQCMGGVKTKISFPNIKALKDRNIVINKAELVVTNIGDNSSFFPPPNRLNILRVDKQGEQSLLPDSYYAYWGGEYNEAKREYRFRITKYLQDIILKEDYESYVYLVSYRAAADAYRLILNGTQHDLSPTRLRLELYYTEY